MDRDRVKRVSWLCATQADRERVLDMEQRLKPLRTVSFGVLALALLVCAPWVGWWPVLPLAVAAIVFVLTDRGLADARRPEYRVALAWLSSEVAIAVGVALTGGPSSPAVSWLVLPVVTLAARFDIRGVVAGSTVAAVLILASALGIDPAAVFHAPQAVFFRLALLGAVPLLSVALMRSDLQHRTASVIDPLTSMLNRNALALRVEELRHQARIVQQPIGLIIADVDQFKAVNDTHGHAVGDAVLRDVAYNLRKRLRAYDLAYRLGGEEFLILLPGAGVKNAAVLAEELRKTIQDQHHGGISVTMSFGVSASPPRFFDYERVSEAADHALYEAKAAGRNHVHAADLGQPDGRSDEGSPSTHGQPLRPLAPQPS